VRNLTQKPALSFAEGFPRFPFVRMKMRGEFTLSEAEGLYQDGLLGELFRIAAICWVPRNLL
jgi:hypothetical protein